MKKYNVVIKCKCGATHFYFSTDNLELAREKLYHLVAKANDNKFIATKQHGLNYLSTDEVREFRVEDEYQRTVRMGSGE